MFVFRKCSSAQKAILTGVQRRLRTNFLQPIDERGDTCGAEAVVDVDH
jgi:hypothetical protein